MADPSIRFADGASYDLMMGGWSRSVGELFLDWLRPQVDLDWLDVGCGSGAFTRLVVERCAPRSVLGVDPSQAQLEFARSLGLGPNVRFAEQNAMNIELDDRSADIAVAALVVHFMPDPEKGAVEMTRVVRPGGVVAAYAWDLAGGGFPYHPVHEAMRATGLQVPDPPHPEAANAAELERLWQNAGLVEIKQHEFSVTHTFRDADEYWRLATTAPRIAVVINDLPPNRVTLVKQATQDLLSPAANGGIAHTASANAISGRKRLY